MESIRWRKPALKPIQTRGISKRVSTDIQQQEEEDERQEIINAEAAEEPLSPAARLFHEPSFNVYIIAIMGSKTPINPDVIYQHLPHTLLKHPRFSSLQVMDEKSGVMKWVLTKVNLENHIIIPDIPQNLENTDKFVQDYLYNLSKTSIDRSQQPMWDLHLLNVKTSDAEAIAIFRTHHSLGDGTSLMSLLLACTRQLSDPDKVPTITPVNKKSGNSGGFFLWRYFMVVWMVFRLFCNTIVDVVMFMLTAMFLKDTETPLRAPPGAEFTPRRFVYRTVSLDDMKLVKNAMNLTINDVALAITQAGLSRYLNWRYAEKKYDLKGVAERIRRRTTNAGLGRALNYRYAVGRRIGYANEKENDIPKNLRLRSTLLINIRPSSGIQALADMMEKNTEAKWGNWIGYVLLPFTIGLRDDPLDYVREAKATIDRKKNTLEAIYTFSIAELVLKFFGIKAASALSHRIITHTTMCFSNLVGPLEEIGFYGHAMEYLAPSSYGQPHGLMINFQSYTNKMTIVLSVDDNVIPDPGRLLDELEKALRKIKEAVLAKGLVKDVSDQLQAVAFT